MDSKTSDPARPRSLAAAAVLLAAQGLVVVGLGVTLLVRLVVDPPEQLLSAATLAATVLVLAVLPLAAARGLWTLRRWSRGPATVVQIMVLPVAWQLVQEGGGRMIGGLVLGATAVAALGVLLSPATVTALGIDARR